MSVTSGSKIICFHLFFISLPYFLNPGITGTRSLEFIHHIIITFAAYIISSLYTILSCLPTYLFLVSYAPSFLLLLSAQFYTPVYEDTPTNIRTPLTLHSPSFVPFPPPPSQPNYITSYNLCTYLQTAPPLSLTYAHKHNNLTRRTMPAELLHLGRAYPEGAGGYAVFRKRLHAAFAARRGLGNGGADEAAVRDGIAKAEYVKRGGLLFSLIPCFFISSLGRLRG